MRPVDHPSSVAEGGNGLARGSRGEATRAPAVRLVDAYLAEAARRRASDLHFEPCESGMRVRVRSDGLLHDCARPPASLHSALITRLKLLANVDLAQQRLPQDGAFGVDIGADGRLDVRAAFMPVVGGCKVALRIVQHGARSLALSELGMNDVTLATFRRALSKPDGLITVVGPTGSGKTTTLYSALGHLRGPSRSIMTVEDPVELRLGGISQVEVDDAVGRDFPTVLRALLRQDPDIMMVGEMRDPASAGIGCRAALTGHLVLSTLHTSDCNEALVRLRDLGIADHLVSSTVSLVVAQRLLRALCRDCAGCSPITDAQRRIFERHGVASPSSLPVARGCERCEGVGYAGRFAIFEVLEGSRRGGGTLDSRAPSARSLLEAGLRSVADGHTSIAQVLAHCPEPAGGNASNGQGAPR